MGAPAPTANACLEMEMSGVDSFKKAETGSHGAVASQALS